MSQKVKCIMLVDDNKFDNMFHERTISRNYCADKTIALRSGHEALEYLRNIEKHGNIIPELIFLDINMPQMSGWEFIEEFKKLDPTLRSQIVLVMLSTSNNPDDIRKAQSIELVSDFKIKPLTNEMLDDVIGRYCKSGR